MSLVSYEVAGDLADQVIVIGAHYDHLGYGEIGSMAGVDEIHPGADDNASGTAGVVMLAQRFARRINGVEHRIEEAKNVYLEQFLTA